ncbi:CTP synthetase [Rhodobacteraceae bacterium W635]|uniref:CTP synthetase n=1 Tax=Nioella halotolerans TaxID=2303578 RepID=UPI000E3CA69C|nr:CTP synthetase [Rhodobacteraceae bacterium W635]
MRLFFLIFIMAGVTLAGIGVTAALASGFDGARGVIIAAVIGAVVALPVAWFAARKIRNL